MKVNKSRIHLQLKFSVGILLNKVLFYSLLNLEDTCGSYANHRKWGLTAENRYSIKIGFSRENFLFV